MADDVAIGRIVVGDREKGTGFAVSSRHVVTAFHCVRDDSGQPSAGKVAFLLGDRERLAASVSAWDADSDLAVLGLEAELPAGWEPVVIARTAAPLRDVRFQTEGFPTDERSTRERILAHGEILSSSSVDGRAPALVLYADEVAARRDPHGFSGAPVLVELRWPGTAGEEQGWAAVAAVRWAPARPDGSAGHGGQLYASPLEAIATKCEALAQLLVDARRPGRDEVPAGPPSRRGRRIDFGEELRAAKGFVGRESLLEEIAAFAAAHDRGYVHLEASAGLGKSALAARFAVLEQAPAFFADAGKGTVRAEDCLAHLSAELVDRYGLSDELLGEEAGSSAATLAAILGDAAARAGEPLWLVVDGLDEAEDPPPGTNPLLLPRQLPPGAFVLVTSREPASELDVDPSTPLRAMRLSAEGEAERRDLERYVEHRCRTEPGLGAALAESALTARELARRLADAGEGNFMYVTYVLADAGEGAIDLETPPPRLSGYYERRFWAAMEEVRERDREAWEQLFRPVLSRLAVASEPVDAGWLARQVGRPAEDIDQLVLHPWRRFLRTAAVDGERGWRIVHRSFADFLESKFDLPAVHREVAAAIRASPDAYGSRHLSEHLRAAGESDELLALVRDPHWERSQLAADPSGRLFVHDVEQAWLAAETRGQLDLEVWCALAIASTRSGTQLIPPAFMAALVEEGLWSFERARDTVLQAPDPAHRALSLVALSRWEPALLEDAVAALAEVARIVARAEALGPVAEALPEERRLELLAAFLAEPEATDSYDGPHAVARLVPLLPNELLPRAVEIARRAPHAVERTVLTIALSQRLGQPLLGEPAVSECFAEMGLPEQLVGALEAEPGTVEAARRAAVLLTEMADHDGLAWAGSQRNDGWVLTALAPRLDREGLLRALAVAEAADVGSFGVGDALAVALARSGDPGAAWSTLVADPFPRAGSLRLVAKNLPASLAASAVAGAAGFADGYLRAEALGLLCPLLSRAERRAVLAEGLPDQTLADGPALARALRPVSPYLTPEQGREALPLVSGIESSSELAHGLAALAPALAPAELESAFRVATLIAYKAEDIARAAIVRELPPDAVRVAAEHLVAGHEFGLRAAVAIADSLDAAGRASLVELLAAQPLPGTGNAVLGLAPHLSEEQVRRLAPLLDRREAEWLETLRAIFPGRREGEPRAAIAARLLELDVAEDLIAHQAVALAASGEGAEAVELAAALDNGAVTMALAEHRQAIPKERRAELAELALRIRSWDGRLQALIRLADDLDRESLGRLCVRLEELGLLLASQVDEGQREVARMQRRASLLPLYARLPAADHESLVTELREWLAASEWGDALDVLAAIDPLGDRLPVELRAMLYPAVGSVLHQLAFQPRGQALASLRWMVPVLIGIGGPAAATAVGQVLLDVGERWP